MKRKVLLALLALLLIASLAACAAPAPAPAPAPTATVTAPAATVTAPATTVTAPAPVPAPGKVTEWRWFLVTGNDWDVRIGVPQLVKEIETATDGQLKIEVFYPGEHPYTIGDMLVAISEGNCEIAQISHGYSSTVDPRLAVLDLPMLIPGGVFKTAGEVYDAVNEQLFSGIWGNYNVQPILKSEWGSQAVWLKPEFGFIENWDSLKGLKIRTWSRETADLITTLGGEPVSIAGSEVYTALQTGLLDGLVTSPEGVFGMRATEVVKRGSLLAALYPVISFTANSDALAELPTDVRDSFLGLMADRADWFEEGNIKGEGVALQAMVLLDFVQVHPIPKAFREELREASYEGIWKPWMERAGPEGVAGFNQVAEILINMGHTVPGYQP